MTSHKHLKQLVRARMSRTGERYAAARRQVISQLSAEPSGPVRAHLAGSVPATTALRVLLRHAGLGPVSEAELFVAAGGIGAGVFAFVYEQHDMVSLFLAGRHLWQDDLEYLNRAARRFGVRPVVREATAKGAAERQLREAVADGRPVVVWVDSASLPHRSMPEWCRGGGYHVITVYGIECDHAMIGDLTDEPVAIALGDLAQARARIKKQKHRLWWVEGTPRGGLDRIAADGCKACFEGLTRNRQKNFRLDGFRDLADRMHGHKGKESWDASFPPGKRLWTALTSLYEYIEHYGSGGGLCRPIFAEGLARLGRTDAARRYADLGAAWSALAHAALPDQVPLLAEAKETIARRAELCHAAESPEEIAACWADLARMAASAKERFPLSAGQSEELRRELQRQLYAIHAQEVEAAELLTAGRGDGQG